MFQGQLSRPKDITTEEEQIAAVAKFQEELKTELALRAAQAIFSGQADTIATRSSSTIPTVTPAAAVARNKKEQEKWDDWDIMALSYVKATISAQMTVYVNKGATSWHIFNVYMSMIGCYRYSEGFFFLLK